jgi:hypothetical protein
MFAGPEAGLTPVSFDVRAGGFAAGVKQHDQFR